LNGSAESVYIDDLADAATPSIGTGVDIYYIGGAGAGTAYYFGSDISEFQAVNCDIAEFYLNTVRIWTFRSPPIAGFSSVPPAARREEMMGQFNAALSQAVILCILGGARQPGGVA
jgi:hypothetical protein